MQLWGEFMYIITKIINNNIVCSKDNSGAEVILRGLGIGFKKRIGMTVDDKDIEKIYKSSKDEVNKMQQLFSDIPIEYIDLCSEIIDLAEKVLGKSLNKNINITLTDHISFAIERKQKNLEYKNALLSEIKSFYPKEYEIGIKAIQLIKDRLFIELSEDEAGFIALHIVNAELGTNMNNMFDITELIQAVTEIVQNYYKIELDRESLDYSRFITHMKFFGQRVFKNKIAENDDAVFHEMIKQRYKNDYECSVKIRGYILAKYNRMITEEEMIFLTVHLRRISKSGL